MIDSGHADRGMVRDPASSTSARTARTPGECAFRNPVADDAAAIFALIAACPPLDPNSLYCNLLQCTHFAESCIVAERDGAMVGWISGYRPPRDTETIFVWQVAVDADARGTGLGVAMLDELLHLPAVADATRLETTITPSNFASRRLFASIAARHDAAMESRPWFDAERHFGGGHESEELISIAPLPPRTA